MKQLSLTSTGRILVTKYFGKGDDYFEEFLHWMGVVSTRVINLPHRVYLDLRETDFTSSSEEGLSPSYESIQQEEVREQMNQMKNQEQWGTKGSPIVKALVPIMDFFNHFEPQKESDFVAFSVFNEIRHQTNGKGAIY